MSQKRALAQRKFNLVHQTVSESQRSKYTRVWHGACADALPEWMVVSSPDPTLLRGETLALRRAIEQNGVPGRLWL